LACDFPHDVLSVLPGPYHFVVSSAVGIGGVEMSDSEIDSPVDGANR
jgi:hypothetical protein